MQSIATGIIVLGAIAYLVYYFYKKNKNTKCGKGDCGCK